MKQADLPDAAPATQAEVRQARRVLAVAGVVALVAAIAVGIGIYRQGGIPISIAKQGIEVNAEAGNPKAQFRLAMMYYPSGKTPDPAKAQQLLTAAAEQGHTDAQFALATMLRNGEGIPQGPGGSLPLAKEGGTGWSFGCSDGLGNGVPERGCVPGTSWGGGEPYIWAEAETPASARNGGTAAAYNPGGCARRLCKRTGVV